MAANPDGPDRTRHALKTGTKLRNVGRVIEKNSVLVTGVAENFEFLAFVFGKPLLTGTRQLGFGFGCDTLVAGRIPNVRVTDRPLQIPTQTRSWREALCALRHQAPE